MRTPLTYTKNKITLIDKDGYRKDFYIDKCIGMGASCIVYHAKCDDNTEHLLKEFYPKRLMLNRAEDGNILVPESDKPAFDYGLEQFVKGCEMQKSLRLNEELKNFTCNVQGMYYGNGTQYLDTSFFSGSTYEYVNESSLYNLMNRMKTLAKVIGYYHKNGFLHLDIKPNNIFVRPESETIDDIMLFDFDSVIPISEVCNSQSLSYTQSWAASEQIIYKNRKYIGPHTDIFAIGEIIFHQIFGRHSECNERWSFSTFDFDKESDIFKNVNPRVFDELSVLLNRTICDLWSNRFSNTDSLIEQIDRVIALSDPKTPYIGKNQPYMQSFFVGRDQEMNAIHSALLNNDVVFLHGIGGIGKSELAKQYAKKYSDEYESVIFVPYIGSVHIMISSDVYMPINNFLPYTDEKPNDYYNRKLRKLKELCDKNTLIIIDNLDCADDTEISKLFELGCKLLITSRINFDEYGYGQCIEITALSSSDDMIKIFRQHYTKDLSKKEKSAVEKIINTTGGHTMAIELLAKQMMAGRTTPEKMLNKLQNSGIVETGTEKVSSGKDGKLSSENTYSHLKVLFDLSDLSDSEKHILFNLDLIPQTGINAELFYDWCELTNYNDINELRINGWLRQDNDDNISLHPLIADVISENLKAVDDLDFVMLKNITAYIKSDEFNLLTSRKRKVAVTILFGISCRIYRYDLNCSSAAEFLSKAISVFYIFGNINEGIMYGKKAVSIVENLHTSSQADLADVYIYIARYLDNIGKYKDAEEYLQKSLKIVLDLCGEKSIDASTIYSDLGQIYDYLGMPLEAEIHLKKALEIRLSKLKKNDKRIASSYDRLGSHYVMQNDFKEAEEYFIKALSVLTSRDVNTELIYTIYNNLGVAYQKQNNFEQAEKYLNKSLENKKKFWGGKNIEIGYSYQNLGVLYREMGEYDLAVKYTKKALFILKEIFGENNPHTATSYAAMGNIYKALNQYDEALKFYTKALDIRKELLGDDHPYTVKTIEYISDLNK